MPAKRRMGPQNSESREAMFDAVEVILRTEGVAAVTARRIAETAGFNHQTVYYYFQSMDDLILGAFRRRTERSLKSLEAALEADRPLHALSELYTNFPDGKLSFEFSALASRSPAVQKEVKRFLDLSRTMLESFLTRVLEKGGIDPDVCPPTVAAMLIGSVYQFLARDTAIGFARGHREMKAFIEWCLSRFEPLLQVVPSEHDPATTSVRPLKRERRRV